MTMGTSGNWNQFTFKMAEPEDYPGMLDHLRSNFYVDEPLNVLTGYSELKAGDMDDLVNAMLPCGLSMVFHDKATKKIAGVRITAEHLRGAKDPLPEMKSVEMKKIFPFLLKLDAEAKVFQAYPNVDRYAELFMASVDREFRGQGLATVMYEKALIVLREKGFTLAKSSFTSPYTQRIAKKMGFRELARCYFKEHRDENGELVFPNAADDEYATAAVLEL